MASVQSGERTESSAKRSEQYREMQYLPYSAIFPTVYFREYLNIHKNGEWMQCDDVCRVKLANVGLKYLLEI